jgi:hypothetical protein
MKRTDRDPIDKLRTGVHKSVTKELQKLGVGSPAHKSQHAEKRAA